ncbi:MAG: hypothetical protein IJ019_00425 [Alphaproteobacteria bacterium]|nr:hypothetical protein [Alphaproteobacteria bacterium]
MIDIKNMFKTVILVFICMGYFETQAKYPENCVFLISGECFDCNSAYTLQMGHEQNCVTHCPNRFYRKGKYYKTCQLTDDNTLNFPKLFFDSENTSRENCKKDGYFYGIHNDDCYSCDTTAPVFISPSCAQDKNCIQQCPNRTILYVSQTEVVSVTKCPTERPLMDKFLLCWSCDETTPIDMSFNQDKIWDTAQNPCLGLRYIDKISNPFSMLCPEDKKNLSEEACHQCLGIWKDNQCK